MADEIDNIEVRTLSHYNNSAESFWQGTKDHDVSQNYAEFLRPFPPGGKLKILDLGCGPGRDVKYFDSLGHSVVGLDGCENFCRMARDYTACEILHQNFLDLNLPAGAFDGIFANASLFHVPSRELPRVLLALHAALRAGGILFTSNPRGNDEGWSGERYGHYMELERSREFLQEAGFELVKHYYRPEGRPQGQQPWLAIVSRSV